MRIINYNPNQLHDLTPAKFFSSIFEVSQSDSSPRNTLPVKNRLQSEDITFDQSEDEFVFQWVIPGIRKNQLQLSLEDQTLSVSMSLNEDTKTENNDPNAVTRTIQLPENSEKQKIKANLDHGILKIMVPKIPKAKARKISIG
jgi:HSP20 family protein